MIKKTVEDFIRFLKKPNDEQIDINLRNKVFFVLSLLLLQLAIQVILVFPLVYTVNEIIPFKNRRVSYDETISFVIFSSVFLVPLIEEFLFRFILRYEGLKSAFISKTQWIKIFPSLVYLFSIGFGLIHITNYLNEGFVFLLLAPLITLSQILAGFILTFIRVRLNFYWGLIFHSTWNFLVFVVILFTTAIFSEPYFKKTTTYTISITENAFFDDSKKHTFKIDSVKNKLKTITVEQYSLQHILDTLYKKDKYYVDDVLIDLQYKSKNGLTKKEFLKILKNEYEIE